MKSAIFSVSSTQDIRFKNQDISNPIKSYISEMGKRGLSFPEVSETVLFNSIRILQALKIGILFKKHGQL